MTQMKHVKMYIKYVFTNVKKYLAIKKPPPLFSFCYKSVHSTRFAQILPCSFSFQYLNSPATDIQLGLAYSYRCISCGDRPRTSSCFCV